MRGRVIVAALLAIAVVVTYVGVRLRSGALAERKRAAAAAYERFAQECERGGKSLAQFGHSQKGASFSRDPAELRTLNERLSKVTAGMNAQEVQTLVGAPDYMKPYRHQGTTPICEWVYVYSGKRTAQGFMPEQENGIGFGDDGRVALPATGPWTTVERK